MRIFLQYPVMWMPRSASEMATSSKKVLEVREKNRGGRTLD